VRVAVLRLLGAAAPLTRVWALNRTLAAATLALVVLRSLCAAGAMVLVAATAQAAVEGDESVMALVTLIGVAVLARQCVDAVLTAVVSVGSARISQHYESTVLELSLGRLRQSDIEDPQVQDVLNGARGREVTANTLRIFLPCATGVTSARLEGLAGLVLVAAASWYAPLVLVPVVAVIRWWLRGEVASASASQASAARSLRRAAYYRDVALDANVASEIRLLGRQSFISRLFRDSWTSAMEIVWAGRRARRSRTFIAGSAVAASLAATLLAVGVAAIEGNISIATAVLVAQAAPSVLEAAFAGDMELLAEQGVVAARSLQELGQRVAPRPARRARTALVTGDALTAVDVSFAYDGAGSESLIDVSLSVGRGEVIAIVGENGSGKSTLVKVLTGLFTPTSGAVVADGIGAPDLTDPQWIARLSYLPQQTGRLPGTVEEIVSTFRCDDRDRVHAALGLAGLDGFVSRLARGIETQLGTVDAIVEPSGGEWRRLAIASAFYRVLGGAELLVLDEPTSSLSPRAEADLFHRLLTSRALPPETTLLLVTHRLSAASAADRITVLHAGRVAESGTHAGLLAGGSLYRTMFEAQASAYDLVGGAPV